MFHPAIINTVAQDLAKLRCDLSSYWVPESHVIPATLSLCADGIAIRDIIENRALRLELSTLARNAFDFTYAIKLAETFLSERLEMEDAPDSISFIEQIIANLQPNGSHFEFFQVQLFEEANCLLQTSHRTCPYSMTLETKELTHPSKENKAEGALSLRRVVYDQSEQLACLASVYKACEAIYLKSCDRFGVEKQDHFSAACWDMFRYALGELTSIFRDPSRAAEKEWIGIAFANEASSGNEHLEFDLNEDVFIPFRRLNLGRKHEKKRNSICSITINSSVLPLNAEVGMRAFLAKNSLFQVAVNNVSHRSRKFLG